MIAWILWATAMTLSALSVVLIGFGWNAPLPDQWGFRGYNDMLAPVGATVGLLIAMRERGNPIGWLLLLSAVASAFLGFAQEYATYAVLVHPGSLPGAVPLAWVCSWVFGLAAGPVLMLIPQLFPTGQPLTRRWRPLVWLGWVFVPAVFVVFGLRPGPLENASFVDNPVVLPAWGASLIAALAPLLYVLIAGSALASGASLVLRFRRSRGSERQQLKWIALSGAFVAVAFIWLISTTPIGSTSTFKPAQILMVAAFASLPVAIGIAILRYRLYDIDLIINRAIVYGALSAVIAAAYFVLVVLFQAIMRPITGGSEIAVAASTLAVIALVQPLRGRIRAAVDRRFYRSRYDAARTLDEFTTRLRDEVDLETVRRDIVGVAADTVQPRHASLWLREQRL